MSPWVYEFCLGWSDIIYKTCWRVPFVSRMLLDSVDSSLRSRTLQGATDRWLVKASIPFPSIFGCSSPQKAQMLIFIDLSTVHPSLKQPMEGFIIIINVNIWAISLLSGHHSAIIKSLLKWFKCHCKRFHVDIKRDCMCG